jgi:hypothetical protein
MQTPLLNPSPLSDLNQAPPSTPSRRAPPFQHPNPDPAWQRTSPATPRQPGRRHARRGHPDRASKPPSIPRPVTSPLEPPGHLGSIPQAKPARDLPCVPPRSCHPDVTVSPSTRRACSVFPCTCTPSSPAPHQNLHGSMSPARRHCCPASSSTHTTEPSLNPIAPRLKPRVFRPNRLATDNTTDTPALGPQCRPQTPPAAPNRVRGHPP